jgi:hypothetical protein
MSDPRGTIFDITLNILGEIKNVKLFLDYGIEYEPYEAAAIVSVNDEEAKEMAEELLYQIEHEFPAWRGYGIAYLPESTAPTLDKENSL